jgi:hypothetical protein
VAGALALLTACGSPPQPLPTSPPYTAASAAPSSFGPALPTLGQSLPTLGQPLPTPTGAMPYPTYAVPTVATTTNLATRSPTPTPAHAAKCTGQPTGAQILTLIKGEDGVPGDPLSIYQGPFCSGVWSFATVEVTGKNEDEVEPLMVIATGKGNTLTLVAAGSEVCTDPVQTGAPPSIRVLACGF